MSQPAWSSKCVASPTGIMPPEFSSSTSYPKFSSGAKQTKPKSYESPFSISAQDCGSLWKADGGIFNGGSSWLQRGMPEPVTVKAPQIALLPRTLGGKDSKAAPSNAMAWQMNKLHLNDQPPISRDISEKDCAGMRSAQLSKEVRSAHSPARSIGSKSSASSFESPRAIPFRHHSEEEAGPYKTSWASIVTGPTKVAKSITVIRSKAAPLAVIPRLSGGRSADHGDVGSAGYQAMAASNAFDPDRFPGQVRILQRSESDNFGISKREIDATSFVPGYIQLQQGYKGPARISSGGGPKQNSDDLAPSEKRNLWEGRNDEASYAELPFRIPEPFCSFTPQKFVEHLRSENKYNPGSLVLNFKNARCFIVECANRYDLLYSIVYNVWASADYWNRRLDAVFAEQDGVGPVYLFFRLRDSGSFCGMVEILSGFEEQTKFGNSGGNRWRAHFRVKWIFLKDVPDHLFLHISAVNNEDNRATSLDDFTEISLVEAKQVAKIIQTCFSQTSLLNAFVENQS